MLAGYKALVDFGVASEDGEHLLARDLGDMHAIDSGYGDRAAISQHIEAAGKVVASLAVGNNAFVAFGTASSRRGAMRYFDKSLHNNMQRFTRWLPLITFGKKLLVAVKVFKLCLVGDPANVGISNTLEDRHALHDGFDRAGIVQLFKECVYSWHYLHHALHDLIWNLQYYRGCLRTHSGITRLARQHPTFTNKLTAPQYRYRQVFIIGASGGDEETTLEEKGDL